jgi:hypothetical protein
MAATHACTAQARTRTRMRTPLKPARCDRLKTVLRLPRHVECALRPRGAAAANQAAAIGLRAAACDPTQQQAAGGLGVPPAYEALPIARVSSASTASSVPT